MTSGPNDALRPTYSYSRLQKFGQCPAAYELRYIKHTQPTGDSIESYLGNTIHTTLQRLYDTILGSKAVSFDSLLNFYRDEWAKRWSKAIYINTPGWKTDDYFQLGVRMLAGYFRRFSPFSEPVYKTEFDLTFALENDAKIRMRVILDRVDDHGAGHWSIHDYKTGKHKLSAAQAATDLQMRIYYLAIKQTFAEVKRIDVVWHFLRHSEQQRLDDQHWLTNRIVGGLMKRINRVTQAEESTDGFEPKEGILCNWCFHWDCCSAKVGQQHPAFLAD